jgi:hypothetical protein
MMTTKLNYPSIPIIAFLINQYISINVFFNSSFLVICDMWPVNPESTHFHTR